MSWETPSAAGLFQRQEATSHAGVAEQRIPALAYLRDLSAPGSPAGGQQPPVPLSRDGPSSFTVHGGDGRTPDISTAQELRYTLPGSFVNKRLRRIEAVTRRRKASFSAVSALTAFTPSLIYSFCTTKELEECFMCMNNKTTSHISF